MCNFLHHLSCYSSAHNRIFTAYTFSSTFHNFLSLLPQMEPTRSQVRNHYWQTNQQVHHKRALALKKAANLRCPSSICLPIICHRTLCSGTLGSLISSLKQDNYTGKNDLTRRVTHREAVFGPVIHSIFDAWHYEVLWTCNLTRVL